jgi:4-methyl-5(b-hydroxyethyl)-thiazole monophosphate biosynthesis
MMKGEASARRVLVPLADGVEEIEAVCVVDILRRAGCEVVTASVGEKQVTGRTGIGLVADTTWDEAAGQKWDLVVVPGGGPGVARLRKDARVREVLREQGERGGEVAAICAGPLVLADAGLLASRKVACHESAEEEVSRRARVIHLPVVEDGPVTTSRGPGTALEFALRLVRRLCGVEVEDQIRRQIHAV